jgi:hypothetical protein
MVRRWLKAQTVLASLRNSLLTTFLPLKENPTDSSEINLVKSGLSYDSDSKAIIKLLSGRSHRRHWLRLNHHSPVLAISAQTAPHSRRSLDLAG